MKRMVSKLTFLLAAVLLIASLCLGAAAAEGGPDMIQVKADGLKPGNSYVLLLVKPETSIGNIQDSDILFFEQLDSLNGSTLNVAVACPGFTECIALIGGEFSDSASSPRTLREYAVTHMPFALDEIEEEAFANSTLTHVYLGANVTTIGARAFAGCADLTYIYIPAHVSDIAQDAFEGCDNLTIGCAQGSSAYRFAVQNGIPYTFAAQ